MWKARLRRFGCKPGNPFNVFRGHLRNSITLISHLVRDRTEIKALDTFHYFMTNSAKRYEIRKRFRKVFG